MNLGVFEDSGYRKLLPLTWLRPAFELRCGRDRLIDKIQRHAPGRVARYWLREALRHLVEQRNAPAPGDAGADWALLNGRAMVTADVALPARGMAWMQGESLVAACASAADLADVPPATFLDPARLAEWVRRFRVQATPSSVRLIEYPWQLALLNGEELRRQCTDGGVLEGHVHDGAHLLNPRQIHIGAHAVIKPGAVLDAEDGPIHVEANALIQPNAVLEGPCFIGAGALVRPTACIRANTTIGPVCKVGGEIESSIIHGYSNKQHDGFLGHSYVGEWVNLGAATVNSDLKNTYGTIRVFLNGVGVETGERFVGAIIGDHVKTGIGTILPTGCVLGVAANVFTTKIVPKFVPSFAWLTADGMVQCRMEKLLAIARTVMGRRKVELTDADVKLLTQAAEMAFRVEAAGWQ